MITHQEVLELVRILFFNINEKTLQELNRTSKIYDKLDNYITQQEKQEKLLKLYKELISVKNDMFSYCEVVDDIYYYMAETETDLEQQIKEIENES